MLLKMKRHEVWPIWPVTYMKQYKTCSHAQKDAFFRSPIAKCKTTKKWSVTANTTSRADVWNCRHLPTGAPIAVCEGPRPSCEDSSRQVQTLSDRWQERQRWVGFCLLFCCFWFLGIVLHVKVSCRCRWSRDLSLDVRVGEGVTLRTQGVVQDGDTESSLNTRSAFTARFIK